MKKIIFCILLLNTVSAFADEQNCRNQIRELRKEISKSERLNVDTISYLSTVGEYLVKSGRSIKAVINSGGRIAASTGDTLVYSGNEVISSASSALSDTSQQVDNLAAKLDAIEDRIN